MILFLKHQIFFQRFRIYILNLYQKKKKNRNDEILLKTLHYYEGIFFKFQHICNIYVLAQRYI